MWYAGGMPSSRVARFPSFLVAMAALPAQVSVSVVAATPVSVVATSGPTSNSNALPAGPLPPGLLVLSAQAAGGATSATFQTDAVAAATGVTCSFGQGVVVGNVGDTAACAPVSLRVQFAAAAPTPVRLRVAYEDITPAGAPQPRADIDVGDDGTIDYVNGVAQGPVTLLVAGPQPLVLRVLLENALAQPGAIFSDLTVELLPDNDVVITPAVVGCAPV